MATALQMALVADGIANRGVIMTPHVMSEIHDSSGDLVDQLHAPALADGHQPADGGGRDHAHAGGGDRRHGRQVGFPPLWDVAAKTGTAQTGPNATLTNDWMIAFAPANNPKVAVAVVVPNQPGSSTGRLGVGAAVKTILGRRTGGDAVSRSAERGGRPDAARYEYTGTER